MSADVVGLAVRRLAVVDDQIRRLQDEITVLSGESAKLKEFIDTAKALMKAPDQPSLFDHPPAETITIRKDTWAARVAIFLKSRSHMPPQSARVVIAEVAKEKGHSRGDGDWVKTLNIINSAIWRRKDDLFSRDGDVLKLRTTNFELVDNPTAKEEGDEPAL